MKLTDEALEAWRDGYESGFAAGREVGEGFAGRDDVWREVAAYVRGLDATTFDEQELVRWSVRGRPGTRERFGLPVFDDYLGHPRFREEVVA